MSLNLEDFKILVFEIGAKEWNQDSYCASAGLLPVSNMLLFKKAYNVMIIVFARAKSL